jgi:hypothetical protein
MPPSEEAANLILTLATELAFFCKLERSGPPGTRLRHVGLHDRDLCTGSVYITAQGNREERKCSTRCDRVNLVLQLAAERLGISVEDIYRKMQEIGKPKKKRKAEQPSLLG